MIKLLIALVLFIPLNLNAQDTLRLNFNPDFFLTNQGGHGFMKLIDNHSNKIQYDDKKYDVKFPDRFFVSDTALAFNYFTGRENSKIPNTVTFLFGNYQQKSPIVYVDYNGNLDFSDDGLPLKFNSDSSLTVYLSNSNNPTAKFPIKLYYPQLSSSQKVQIASLIKSKGPDGIGNNIVDIEYWLADKRLNNKITNSWLKGKPIKIGLCDYNCNGLFDDEGEDRILIGDYSANSISSELNKGAFIYEKNMQIQLAGDIYQIVEIESSGQFIKLIKSTQVYQKPLGIGDKIDDLDIHLTSGEKVNIKSLQKNNKYLLIDFWGSWCIGCTQQLPDLKRLGVDYFAQLQIIGLNYGDDSTTIQKYLIKHSIDWKTGIADDHIMTKLKVDGFPNYQLLAPNGEILLLNADLTEIESILLEKTKKTLGK